MDRRLGIHISEGTKPHHPRKQKSAGISLSIIFWNIVDIRFFIPFMSEIILVIKKSYLIFILLDPTQ